MASVFWFQKDRFFSQKKQKERFYHFLFKLSIYYKTI